MYDKNESMYVKGCVVANGLKDTQNDVITKKDIKRVFTNSLDIGFDVDHDNIRQEGIYSIENYISREEEHIGKHAVPSGSWMTVLRIDNKEIQDKIRKNEINGVSISAYVELDAELDSAHNKRNYLLYKDIKEKDKLHPMEISLVKHPANALPLEVMTYDKYLSKSRKGVENMSDKQDENNDQLSIIKELTGIVNKLLAKKDDDTTETASEEEDAEEEDAAEPVEKQEQATETGEDNESSEELPENNEELEENNTKEESEETADETTADEENVSKSMMPQQQQPQQGNTMPNQQPMGDANQVLLQIAKLCTQFFNGQQQQPQQPQQQQGVMNSTEKPEIQQVNKTETVSKKVTQKMDATEIPPVNHGDSMSLFAKQQGRDPWTFEKLD